MTSLKVSVESDSMNPGKKRYKNKVNAENFKEVALVLEDLKNLGVPIEKALKEFKLKKSDWNVALGV